MAHKKSKETAEAPNKKWDESMLGKEDLARYKFVKERIEDLKETRKDHYGVNLDKLWDEADQAYIPHRLNTGTKRKMVVTDEEKGLRGALVELGGNEWQSDISQPNPFVKISTAAAILIDQNPSGVFTPASKKFVATNELMKQLYERSWEVAQSKGQLKLFVHNLSKYGFAAARTFPMKLERKVRVPKEPNPEEPDKVEYDEKTVTEYDDVFRENLDPRNVWIDDRARPNNRYSVRDWCWRKVYSKDAFDEEFGKYENHKFVQVGGMTEETVAPTPQSKTKNIKQKDLIEVYFYENRLKDIFVAMANGVPILIEPLPIADTNGVKKLSLWHAYWTLRNAESIYGIGIYEAIRFEQGMLDRIRNMTIDQLTLAIYKMFFYQGTQQLSNTGEIKIVPGVGKQVLDPKSINWLEVPGPGQDAWDGMAMFRKALDEASGITDPLIGEVTGKTAFELAQAKESALKRMKTPLDNILDALNEEGYITIALMQLLYSTPEVIAITDQETVDEYLQEIQNDLDLYEQDFDEAGNATETRALVYREFPLNLGKDEKGNLMATNETDFFRVKPKYLKWQGIINIKAQSILSSSKQVDKALELEMWNMLIPLFTQPPELYMKTAIAICRLYEKDPRDVIPDVWLNPPPPPEEPLFIDENAPPEAQSPAAAGGATQQPGTNQQFSENRAPRMVGSVAMPRQQTSIAGKLMNRVTQGVR